MKSVLISIQPEWCELIANGKKTVEVRKSRPKLETPFKCYIYCTNDRKYMLDKSESGKIYINGNIYRDFPMGLNSKVIGEFVCDCIEEVKKNEVFNADALYSQSCLTTDEFLNYIGNKTAYCWHISDLVIYDKPKELKEFYSKCNKFDLDKKEVYEAYCTDCDNKYGISPCEYINKKWCVPITRPPQSWCYVEGVRENE